MLIVFYQNHIKTNLLLQRVEVLTSYVHKYTAILGQEQQIDGIKYKLNAGIKLHQH